MPDSLGHLYEDDDQGIEGQRLNQGQTQNERQLDARTSRRIARQTLGGRRGCPRVCQPADRRGDRHRKSRRDGDPVRSATRGTPLRQCRHRTAQHRQQQEKVAQFAHGISLLFAMNYRQEVVDVIPRADVLTLAENSSQFSVLSLHFSGPGLTNRRLLKSSGSTAPKAMSLTPPSTENREPRIGNFY